MMRQGLSRPLRAVLCRFAHAQAGAVTVDYVVLTAGVMIIGLGVLASISDTSSGVGARIQGELDSGSSAGAETGGSGAGTGGGAFTGGGGLPPLPMPPQTPGDSEPAPPQDTDNSSGGPDSSNGGGIGDAGSGSSSDGTGDDTDNPDGGDAQPPEHADDNASSAAPDPGAGGAGGSQGDAPPAEVDFSFDDLAIGCWWSDRAISSWLSLNLSEPTAFSLSGPGNPTADISGGERADTGMVQWGTNIEIDIPPPGGSHTVYMSLGDQVGSFTISRADCP